MMIFFNLLLFLPLKKKKELLTSLEGHGGIHNVVFRHNFHFLLVFNYLDFSAVIYSRKTF